MGGNLQNHGNAALDPNHIYKEGSILRFFKTELTTSISMDLLYLSINPINGVIVSCSHFSNNALTPMTSKNWLRDIANTSHLIKRCTQLLRCKDELQLIS